MKDRLIEFIRQLLIKTVLPIKRKEDQFLSQFHFSIAFRIAINYVRLFVMYGTIFFIIVVGVYLRVETRDYENYTKERVQLLEEGKLPVGKEKKSSEGVAIFYYDEETDWNSYKRESDPKREQEYLERLYREVVNPKWNSDITMKVVDSSTKEVLYNDITMDVTEDKQLFNKISYDYEKKGKTIVKSQYIINSGDNAWNVYFQFDFTEHANRLKQFIVLLVIIYIIFVIFVAKFGKSGIERLFRPIQEMSDAANHLTVANLHSHRLNVEGTKNELKDLATTFNKMLDRLELSYESQKQFVSDASHELRTPIAVIQGYANMLDRWGSEDKEVLHESIEAITNEAKSMQDLVEKLLFLSRHDKKTLKLKKVRFNMKQIVEDMVKETKLVVKNRQIEAPVIENAYVYGDQQALKQAVRIFIDNAVKYSREGDTISISCQQEDGECIVTVADTGLGMKKQDMDRIFDRFYRSDEVRNEKIGGHGLGLSIAKLIVLKHTGSIKVRSQYMKGSSFSIILPDYQKLGFFK